LTEQSNENTKIKQQKEQRIGCHYSYGRKTVIRL